MRASLSRRPVLQAAAAAALGALGPGRGRAAPRSLLLAGEPLPPFTFEVDGRPQGLHWTLCETLLETLGLGARWTLMPWRRALLDMQADRLDGLIGSTRGHLNEREDLMAFPEEPLSHVRMHFVSLARKPVHFDGLFTLRGLRVAVLGGYALSPDFMAAAYFKRQSAVSHSQCLRMLLAGRVDVALVDLAAARYFAHAERAGELLHIDPHPYREGQLFLGLSRRRGHAELAQAFGERLRAFKRGPAYAALLQRYGLQRADVEALA